VDLRTAVAALARVEGSLILVDDFLNHRVDPAVIRSIGAGMAQLLGPHQPTLVLTAEASGIPPALACALELGLPMVYAKKYLAKGERTAHGREVTSPTKGSEYRVEVARRLLAPGLRVAIVDDILAQGRTAEALGEIVEEAESTVVGLAFAIEKCFMSGRERLERHGWPVNAIVQVESIDDGQIRIR